MIRRGAAVVALVLLCVGGRGELLAEPRDRLDRFREMASRLLGALEAYGADEDGVDVRPLYALVDEEVIESLDSGGPFASPMFIQAQLDGFAEAWGGAVLGVRAIGGPNARAPLLVGGFTLGTMGRTGSVRVYGRSGGGATLLAVRAWRGSPEVLEWLPTRQGEAQFLVRWTGERSGRGTRALRLDLWRQTGPDAVSVVWSTAEHFPDGLWAAGAEVRPGEVVLRYEARYPGWKPGCEEQTEQVDVYRYQPAAETLALARGHAVNGWHRELQSAVTRFFVALHDRDERTLAELVPDAALRGRLPVHLDPEPACEGRSPGRPGIVTVAAAEERDGRAAPWSLSWARLSQGWRLAAADAVLQ